MFFIRHINSPTALTWEEKNTGDYSYTPKDFTEMDKFFKEYKSIKGDTKR